MPRYDFKSPRLHVEHPIAASETVRATPEQANYLANVMRLKAGDTVLVFNGRDGEWRAELAQPSKKTVEIVPIERVREQTPTPDLHYLFAPLKHARLDYMIQKAVEMGAGVLQPVMTQHVQASRLNVERMRTHAIEAAAQCGVLSIPDCREPVKLTKALQEWPDDRLLVLCDERAEAEDPIETLRAFAGRKLALLIGPEGGFSQEEREFLSHHAFVRTISLGPRILRADTAAVAALALVQAAAGDWSAR